MTILVANVDSTTDTFSQWVTKTNLIADALSNKVVTTNSNTSTGNAAITGTFQSNTITANSIGGGTISLAGNLNITTNTTFTGLRNKLGGGANVQIDTGNSTFRVLTVNSAASNTLVATKLTFSDHSDVAVSTASNAQFLAYNAANTTWYNRTGLVVYYANGDVAFS